MSSCVGLLLAPNVTWNKSEYGFFNQRCALWQYHLIPCPLNVRGTTPSSPTLRRIDQAGRTAILVRRNTLLTSFCSYNTPIWLTASRTRSADIVTLQTLDSYS
ncbi:hypothetical protein PIB30_101749 [Stylosanthes scabra]|uniref:Uncharacterized protein n=1 Tax=Stylosanthes scabra TaxID=79078 RepID=A0ABU6WYG1_9FABA|nr:hypothetical protein [Stylosanthes scabra]